MTFLELFTILYSKKNCQSCVNFGIDSERIIIIEVPQCCFTLHSAARSGSALFRGLAPRTDTVSLALTISLYLLWFRYYISISWLALRIEVQVVIEMAQKTNRQAATDLSTYLIIIHVCLWPSALLNWILILIELCWTTRQERFCSKHRNINSIVIWPHRRLLRSFPITTVQCPPLYAVCRSYKYKSTWTWVIGEFLMWIGGTCLVLNQSSSIYYDISYSNRFPLPSIISCRDQSTHEKKWHNNSAFDWQTSRGPGVFPRIISRAH